MELVKCPPPTTSNLYPGDAVPTPTLPLTTVKVEPPTEKLSFWNVTLDENVWGAVNVCVELSFATFSDNAESDTLPGAVIVASMALVTLPAPIVVKPSLLIATTPVIGFAVATPISSPINI